MKLRVLGCAGAELPDFRPPSFLIDDNLLLDAGTIGSVLTEEEQRNICNIFITHSHLDHIRSIPTLADNFIIKNYLHHTVMVYSICEAITAMKDHLFNNLIWPDFTKIPHPANPILTFNEIETDREYIIDGYVIRAVPVNHTIPSVGYIVSRDGKTLAYTGDTGPTEEFWRYASGIDTLIVEVSFPNSMERLALLTRHLTSALLRVELGKIETLPHRILITHPKPQYFDIIRAEIASLGMNEIELLSDGMVFEF